jgi:hypothetical protein
MPDWQSIKDHIASEWAVIVNAPVTIIAATIVIGLLIWRALAWADGAVIAAKDATIQTITADNNSYKDKLSGASPEQAKAQLESMTGKIEELEAKLTDLAARRLTDHQKVILTENLRLPHDMQHPLVSVAFEMGCSDCQSYAREITNEIRSVRGWENTLLTNSTMLIFGNPADTHLPSGIEIKVPDKTNLRPEQKILMDAFGKADIKFEIIQDSLPPPAGTMMVQVNPTPP